MAYAAPHTALKGDAAPHAAAHGMWGAAYIVSVRMSAFSDNFIYHI